MSNKVQIEFKMVVPTVSGPSCYELADAVASHPRHDAPFEDYFDSIEDAEAFLRRIGFKHNPRCVAKLVTLHADRRYQWWEYQGNDPELASFLIGSRYIVVRFEWVAWDETYNSVFSAKPASK